MKVEHQSPGYYQYECHDPDCAYCYFVKRKEYLRGEVVKALKQSIARPVKIRLKRSQKFWQQAEIDLLKSLVNVPTDELIRDKVFGERTKPSINHRKTMIRQQYNIKPLQRNMRIYHG